jgi:alanine racemase
LLAGTVEPMDMVRVGLALYGIVPEGLRPGPHALSAAAALRPALSVKATPLRLLAIEAGTSVGYGATWSAGRRSTIATLPIGYGDGYARGMGPGAEVLVRGRRAPVVGTIAMDALAVDVTDVAGVDGQDEFVLLGEQGRSRIDVADLARWRTSITWEALATLSARLPRVYHASAGIRGVRTLAGHIEVRREASG